LTAVFYFAKVFGKCISVSIVQQISINSVKSKKRQPGGPAQLSIWHCRHTRPLGKIATHFKKLALISFRKIRVGHIAISSYLPVDRTQHGLDVVHLILHLCMLRVELAETPRHRLLKLPDPLLENFRISPS
jgi:hypothetical protein